MIFSSDTTVSQRLQLFESLLPHAWLEWTGDRLKVVSIRGFGEFLRLNESYSMDCLVHTSDLRNVKIHLESIGESVQTLFFSLNPDFGVSSRISSATMAIDGHQYCLWTFTEVSDHSMRVLQHAAHDFRSPINLIIGVVNMMQFILQETTPDKAEFTKMLEMIKANCKQAIDLTTDVLELAELESREFTLTTRSVGIYDFLSQYVDTHRLLTMKKRIAVDVKANTNALVQINEMKITRVLNNLMNNSVKFSHPASTLTISAEETPDKVLVHVQDEGVGMSEKLLSELFVRYGRSQRRGLDGEVSHGLGMSIVKQIMDLHQGEVAVESKEGIGTKVTLIFNKL